ncbi:MAG TPA: transketolase C-terminal domain-containing protein, partial [Candidatus Paceibacterota bacterium]|nr:transketolase C-terminal domain-containing protein [Candidatus Paceibacterota bacterium]
LAHVAIIATGSLVHHALVAARDLEKKGIKAVVVNIHTIKPLDTTLIEAVAKEAKAIVTVEEHQIAGGLGGAVAEFLAQTLPTPIEFIGVHDQFGQSGTMTQLIEHYGMGREAIKAAVEKVIARKNKSF